MTTTLRVVVAPHDTDASRTRGQANHPDGGVVVASVPPAFRRGHELVWELLGALGKRYDVAGVGKSSTVDWELLVAWLRAHRVRHLALLDAQNLTADLVDDVALLAVNAGLDCWLVANEPVDDKFVDAVAAWPYVRATAADVDAALATAPIPSQPTAAAFPRVPASSFVTFLADVHAMLEPAEAAIVAARFAAARTQAATFVSGATPTETSMLDWLRRQVDSCVTADEMLTVARAAQAAAFMAGWLIQVDLVRLLATAERAPNAAIASPATWTLLRAYKAPYRATACVYAALGSGTDDMRAATVAAIDANGTSVHVADRVEAVPPGAEVHLRAQVALRSMEGAADGDPLFVDEDGAPVTAKLLVAAIRVPVLELGVAVLNGIVSRPALDSGRWANRWGISVQVMA